MINSFHKGRGYVNGAATLVMTVILIVVSTLIIIFASEFSSMQEKSTANMVNSNQAFAAAEAGMEFGIVYLNQNSAAILANPIAGFLAPYSNGSTTNVTLANNSKFSIVYSNPVANDYTLILITSTGVSANNNSTRTVTQLVKFGSVLFSPGTAPLEAQGNVTLSGNSNVVNTSNSTTIITGGSTSLSGSSTTVLSSGTSSTAGTIRSDIQSNNTTLSNMSQTDFFATHFGNSSTAVKNKMAHVYSNTGNTNYKDIIGGMTGTSIWIDQVGGTASINGNTTIGSAANPVLMIVNGNLNLSGNVTIYGYIFVFGVNTIDSITGNVSIFGSISSSGNLNMSGSTTLTFSPTVLSNLQNSSSLRYYAKVPGSWKDF